MYAFVITISIKRVALRAVPNLAILSESLYLLTDTERVLGLKGGKKTRMQRTGRVTTRSKGKY